MNRMQWEAAIHRLRQMEERLPEGSFDRLRELAEAAGVKYHSLLCTKCRKSKIKVFGLWCKIVEVKLS